jgi:hypothetical protein
MSFATIVRNRKSERFVALMSAIAVLLSMMVIFAEPAQAHHPITTANTTCVDREVYIQYTSTSWQIGSAHNNVIIEVSVNGGPWTQVASGAYNAGNNYTFSGTFSGDAYWGQSIRVRSQVVGNWANGVSGGNDHPAATTAPFTVSQDCFNPSCPNGLNEYKIEPVSSGTFGPNDDYTITVNNTGSGPTFDWTSTLPVFQVIAKGGPGANVYDYTGAFSGTGLHAPLNSNSGKYYGLSHITLCTGEPEEPVPTTFSISGSCLFDDAATYTISGQLGEGLTLEVAGQTINTAGPFSVNVGGAGDYDYDVTVADGYVLSGGSPDASGSVNIDDCTPPPSGWVCQNGDVFFMQDASGYQGTLYDTEEEAANDPDCAPPPPPSGWACVDGSAVFIPDATNFDGTLYETQLDAMSDPDCQEVLASTTFTISGNCAASNDAAGFTISGNLGEGVTLEVAGQTLTATGPFSIGVGAAGSYPYTVTLDDGFVLAPGSPAAEATIVIEDCTPAITVTARGLCDNDTPYLEYTATVTGDVAPGADTVTIHWFDANGVERNPADSAHQYTGLPMSGRVLWPGARVDSSGDPTDWPGWVFENGKWVQKDDGFLWARQTGATVTLEVNPTSGPITVVYPPANPTCSANPPDEVLGGEIVDEVDDVDELPFTGLDADILAAVAAVLLGTGFVVVATSRRREDSH